MAGRETPTCTVSEDIPKVFKKFRLSNAAAAAIQMKVDVKTLEIVIEEEMKDVKLEKIAEDLPTSAPRYIVYSYKHTHKDGRISFPLCLIFYCPSCKPDLAMMYASSKQRLVNTLEIAKIYDVRNASELNEEWLTKQLGL